MTRASWTGATLGGARPVGRWSTVGAFVCALLLLVPSAPAQGQAAPPAQAPDTLRLTLEEALDYAEGSNPALRQATNSTDLNTVESRSLWFTQLLPTARLTLFTTGFTGNLTRRGTDDFGNPVANPGADWNYFSNTRHSLGLNWSFQGPSLFQSHRGQTLTNRNRTLDRRRVLSELQVRVQRLYMDALEQRELMRTEEELIEARRIELDVAERLFGLTLRTRVDVLSAELELEQQRLTHRQQESAYQRALLTLRTAMGLADDGPVELADVDLPLFDPSDLDADALIARAREVNPALLQSEVAVRASEVALAQQSSAWWPQVDMGVSVFRTAYEPYSDALFETSIASDLESNFFVQLSFPILNNYFQHDVDEERATVELRNSREADRAARLQLEEDIRGALLDLENQWASLQHSERSVVIAEEALRLGREEYRLGSRSFAELRSSVEQEAATRRQVITARHQFVDALLALEEAVGASVRDVTPEG